MFLFDENYFKSEYREGFLVDSMVKRAWAAQLEVLGHVIAICEKYGLTYWAMWGTLLGAIRHNGYVPWDDDLDIAMKRADYDKFIEVAKEELPDGYVVMSPYTEPEWTEQLAKVSNSHSIKFTDDFLDEYHGFPYSAGIDIFPYDYLPDSEDERNEQANLINMAVNARKNILERDELLASGSYNGEMDKTINEELNSLEHVFGFEFNRSLYLDNQLLCLIDQLSAGYGDSSCEFMTCFGERAKRQAKGGDFVVPSFLLDEMIDHEFEGFSIKVPKYYELLLSICYGNRFMIPIKAGISAHDYPFFKEQVELLREIGRLDEVMEAVERADKRAKYIQREDLPTGEDCEIIDGTGRKVVMYCMSIIDIFGNEERALDKLENTLDFFKMNSNQILLVLLRAPLVEELLERKSQQLANRYRDIVDKYIADGYGIVIKAEKIKYVAKYCDAYYGSANEYVSFFTKESKPIMVQNIDIIN